MINAVIYDSTVEGPRGKGISVAGWLLAGA